MVITDRMVDVLDPEWLALIMEAKELGISKETVQDFLKQPEQKEQIIK